MDNEMIARCGTYCGICVWKDKINCLGCKGQKGNMFYGECDKAVCCISKGYEHCGLCPYLRNWAVRNYIYEKLR